MPDEALGGGCNFLEPAAMACWGAKALRVVRAPSAAFPSIGAVLDPKVFKAYDIRGIYPAELDEDGAYAIGRAYVEQFEPRADRRRARHAALVAVDGRRR